MATKNGRVSNAELARRIQKIEDGIEGLRVLLVNVSVLDTRQQEIIKDISRLDGRINSWSTLNSFGVVIAGIMGFFFGPRQ